MRTCFWAGRSRAEDLATAEGHLRKEAKPTTDNDRGDQFFYPGNQVKKLTETSLSVQNQSLGYHRLRGKKIRQDIEGQAVACPLVLHWQHSSPSVMRG